jgi:hypothetical protein
MIVMMFCCGSALEAQRAGTRAAANKSKNKTRGSLLRAQRATADARRGDRGGGGPGEEGGGGGGVGGGLAAAWTANSGCCWRTTSNKTDRVDI